MIDRSDEEYVHWKRNYLFAFIEPDSTTAEAAADRITTAISPPRGRRAT
jgi:hypothetical protein